MANFFGLPQHCDGLGHLSCPACHDNGALCEGCNSLGTIECDGCAECEPHGPEGLFEQELGGEG